MKRIHVTSTTMIFVGYDKEKKILEIEFIDEEIYQYYNVPFEFMKA